MKLKTLGKYILVDIRKPLGIQPDYDFCRVRKDYFDKAKRNNRYVLVRTPNGEKRFTPQMVKDFEVVEEVFLFPDRPMKMYEITVPRCEKKDEDFYVFDNS